jgi:phosphonoacetaldehyde hydrolase
VTSPASYRHLKAVVFDWAGTIVDFGSLAPAAAFARAFGRFGVEVTAAEARGPMGMAKRDHVAAVLRLPRVAGAWRAARGGEPDEAAVDEVYRVFVPLNVEVVVDHAALVPGAAETVAGLRAGGLKVGSTTGYTRAIMEPLLPLAAAQGYAPDCLVCAGEVPEGRPSPLMMYRCFLELPVWPAAACVKVDDTGVGLGESLAAGGWAVGVALSGNAVGLSLTELRALAPEELRPLRDAAYARLLAAGAHYVIDTIADLPAALAAIEGRLARGERP